jgi:hypothetical protein
MLAESEQALADVLLAESELALSLAELSLSSAQGAPFGGFPQQYLPQEIRIEIVDKTSGLIEVIQDAVIQNNRYGNRLSPAGFLAE